MREYSRLAQASYWESAAWRRGEVSRADNTRGGGAAWRSQFQPRRQAVVARCPPLPAPRLLGHAGLAGGALAAGHVFLIGRHRALGVPTLDERFIDAVEHQRIL